MKSLSKKFFKISILSTLLVFASYDVVFASNKAKSAPKLTKKESRCGPFKVLGLNGKSMAGMPYQIKIGDEVFVGITNERGETISRNTQTGNTCEFGLAYAQYADPEPEMLTGEAQYLELSDPEEEASEEKSAK